MTLAIVGGYRLVRKLGEGPHAVTWLGHPVDDSAPAAVKLYRSADAEAPAREIESLARAAGPHVVGILDVATAADGRVALILERLRPETLAGLLASGPLRSGEAVTILAPLADALDRLHRAGVAHGAVSAAAVGFSDTGAPVLARFGSSQPSSAPPTAAERESSELFEADRRAFAVLCAAVLDAIPGAEGVQEWLAVSSERADWLAALGPRLFAWSAPEPVSFTRSDPPRSRAVQPVPRRPRAPAQPILGTIDRLAAAVSADRLDWLRRQAASVRPRFWVAGAAAVCALVLGIALVPASAEAEREEPSVETAPQPLTSPSDSGESLADTPATDDPASLAVLGDDPAAASLVLLEARERCIRDLSILCLDDVDQPGSSAFERDEELIRSIQGGAEVALPAAPVEASVDELLGGSAIVVVTHPDGQPASILVMRSEAGWRVRDYLDEG